jgi:predicted nucleotidyltransferase component of viral defense system
MINFTQISKKYGLSESLVKKEYYEVLIIKELFNNKIAPALILKGGMALRLVYNSIRLSDDIDLSMKEDITFNEFKTAINQLCNKYDEIIIKDIYEKFNTHFARLTIKSNKNIRDNLNIKIELSKRPILIPYKGISDPMELNSYKFTKISSELFSEIYALGNVLTLETLYNDKLLCLKSRRKVRDVYDFWLLSNLLGKEYTPIYLKEEEETEFKNELKRHLLTKNYQLLDNLYIVDNNKAEEERNQSYEKNGYYSKDFEP